MSFWRAEPDAVLVRVKVQPKSRRPGLGGAKPSADGPRLAIAVTEAPEDGRATRAACETLARALGVANSAVDLVQGAATREKTLRVTGDPVTLRPGLESLA